MKVYATAVALLFASSAYSYVDPGSGQMLWQLLLAFFIGGFFYIGRAWGFVRGLFSRKTEN